MGFRSIQAAKLDGWDGQAASSEFDRLLKDLSLRFGGLPAKETEKQNRQVDLRAAQAEAEASKAGEQPHKEAQEQQFQELAARSRSEEEAKPRTEGQRQQRAVQRDSPMVRSPGTYALLQTTEGSIICRLFEKRRPQHRGQLHRACRRQAGVDPSHDRNQEQGCALQRNYLPSRDSRFHDSGGDPQGTGMGGPGYKFEDETKNPSHRFDKPGKLAMANAGPNTNGSQFFITVASTKWLNGKRTIFGEVVEGYDIVVKISKVRRDHQDRPKKDVVLTSLTIKRT